jgi:hypothetical protein
MLNLLIRTVYVKHFYADFFGSRNIVQQAFSKLQQIALNLSAAVMATADNLLITSNLKRLKKRRLKPTWRIILQYSFSMK